MKFTKDTKLGDIVAQNMSYAETLYQYNLDFCCGGTRSLGEACKNAKVELEELLTVLHETENEKVSTALQFKAWSTELLIDYILKFHHYYIRTEGPKTLELLQTVCSVHATTHSNLLKVKELFTASINDLFNHLIKEEQILFPFIYEIEQAYATGVILPEFHCGSIENPIRVMEEEHSGEGERFRAIEKLTDGYTTPSSGCDSYKLVMKRLRDFQQNLHIHIHVENNILFPRAIKMQTICRVSK